MNQDPFDRRRFLELSALAGAAALCLPGTSAQQPPQQESFIGHSDYGPMPLPAPEWLRDAVIAEIPTRGFNVSNSKNAAKWKSPYGDTTYRAIAAKLDYLKDLGFNVLCLYSIYDCTPVTNLYALRYDQPNPDMGTIADAKDLIAQAHRRGMYVMSNTNHYGVSANSPLLTEHPNWFLPATQLVSGQRIFDLNSPEAREYIVSTHTWWCTDVGLDGWRIDLGSNMFKKSVWTEVVLRCAARNKRIVLAPENRPLVGYIQGSGRHGYAPILDMANSDWLKTKTSAENPYLLKEVSGHNAGEEADKSGCCAANTPQPNTCGREGCFYIKGSRFLYGHNAIFAPIVPWMLAGETFDATHLALAVTKYRPKMLHAWLDWTEVDKYADVVNDFRKICKIRNDHREIFHNNLYETKLIDIPCDSTPASPVKPYARFISGSKTCIVIGNDNAEQDINFQLHIDLVPLGLDRASSLSVTDCWSGTTTSVVPEKLANYLVLVPRDKSPGGGVRVLAISAVDP